MYFPYLMAGIINGCIIDMLLEDIMLYGMHFVWDVFMCEQETQMKAVAFITINVPCIVATNQK